MAVGALAKLDYILYDCGSKPEQGFLKIKNMSWKDNKIVEYIISSKAELKKVAWPNRAEITRYSALVIGISLAIAFFLGACDYALTVGLEQIIR